MIPKPEAGVPVKPLQASALDEALHHIESCLEHDDPEFVQRMHRLQRADTVYAVTIFALLAVSAFLLLVGLATQTRWLWGGGLAFVAAFHVDHRYQRGLARAAEI